MIECEKRTWLFGGSMLLTTTGIGPGAERPLLRVSTWESPVGSGGGAQRDLTTRNLRENRQS